MNRFRAWWIVGLIAVVLALASGAAAKTAYQKTALTGGAATALDGINGSGLADGDFAYVMVDNLVYTYILDADSATAESSPDIIAPDTNAGDKRWILQGINTGSSVVVMGTTRRVSTIADLVAANAAGAGTVDHIILNESVTLTAAFTLTSGVKLQFEGGGKITLGAYNLTADSAADIIAPPDQQIFSENGSGTVTFTNQSVPVPIYWLGTINADGATDDTATIERADAQGRVYIPSGNYGIKDLDLTNPPVIESGVTFTVLSGVTSHGVKFSGDNTNKAPVVGVVYVNVEGRTESFNAVQIDGTHWQIPYIDVLGDASSHSGVSGVVLKSTARAVTFNRIEQIRVRHLLTGVLLESTDSVADYYVYNNSFGPVYISLCNNAIKYYAAATGSGIKNDIWDKVLIDSLDTAGYKGIVFNGAGAVGYPQDEYFKSLHFDDEGTWFDCTTVSPTRVHAFLPGGSDATAYDRNSDGTQRTVVNSGSFGLYQYRNLHQVGSPLFGNVRLQLSTDNDGLKFGAADSITSTRERGMFWVEPLDLSNTTTYRWTASGSGTAEYYCELAAGGDPSLTRPDYVVIDGTTYEIGTLGSLSAGTWGWGDNDTLGFSTVYLRLSSGADPDTLGAAGGDGSIVYNMVWTDTPTAGVYAVMGTGGKKVSRIDMGTVNAPQVRIDSVNDQLFFAVPSSAPADGSVTANEIIWYLDEVGGNLVAKFKYSGGAVHTVTIAVDP